MSETIRSFIAFDIDDEKVLGRIREAQDRLVETGANLKLVKPQNIHVTLRFLGNITPDAIDSLCKEMRGVSFSPFEVEIRGLGVFPNLKYIRVVWAGIQKGADELRSIFNQLEPRLRRLGFKLDPKGFSPHLTIARVRTARNKAEFTRCVKDLEDYEFGTLRAEVLRLKRSVLAPKGPLYSTLYEVSAVKG